MEVERRGAASWRSTVLGLIATLAVVGLGLSSAAAPRVEAAGGATLTMTPSHGFPWEPFDVTYTAPLLATGACSDFAEITWDGAVLENTGAGTIVAGVCEFTATLVPPSDKAAPGPHDIVGSACVIVRAVGTCDPATATPATYTIDAAAAPTLDLSPARGLSLATIVATYVTPASSLGTCGNYASITWDGSELAQTGAGALSGGSCRFTAAFTPPADGASPGAHALTSVSCVLLDVGSSCDPGSTARSTFTIDTTTIAISPSTGLPGATFTATFDMPAGSCSDAVDAQFLWYGVGGLEIGRAPFNAACTATLTGATVPADAYPGANPVTALACFSRTSCDATTAPAVDATYFVQVPTTIELSPASGDGLTPFTATYTQTTSECMFSDVRFGWDGVLDQAWTTPLDTLHLHRVHGPHASARRRARRPRGDGAGLLCRPGRPDLRALDGPPEGRRVHDPVPASRRHAEHREGR